jgi:hypothetical protein
LRDGAPHAADLPAQKAVLPRIGVGAELAPPQPAAQAAPAAALLEGASTKVELGTEPSLALPADALDELPGVQKSSDPGAKEAIMEPAQAEGSAPSDRPKRARVLPTVKARPVKLIPGDRTKGLSVDEF